MLSTFDKSLPGLKKKRKMKEKEIDFLSVYVYVVCIVIVECCAVPGTTFVLPTVTVA